MIATCPARDRGNATLEKRAVVTRGNPILADGSFYSADPAPLVIDETLYIIAGRDEAPPAVNDFVMREWQIFSTKDVPGGHWTHYPGVLRPERVFKWAAPGRAYAAQMVRAGGRVYLYAPVIEANSEQRDAFAIGVAVADGPFGPWRDAHPRGPIISQTLPQPNKIQNIDPTVLVDDDGRIYLYWGTFGELRGVELEADMVTPKGHVVEVRTLPGFFEASWLFKRKGTYYLAYAGNEAGPSSACTPAIYHACIAYGTSPSPLGPWTYRGVILAPVSSTTSHPGIVEFKQQWYLAYHSADAVNGGHFRRSVAIDELTWDDDEQPPRIRKVTATRAPVPTSAPSRNIAPSATAHASNEPVPVRYWIKALNDGVVRENPLPPDVWASSAPNNPAQQWIEYRWDKPVSIDGSRIWFWADHPAGASDGVAPPKAWSLQYWSGSGWLAVAHPTGFGTQVGRFLSTGFDPVVTRRVRATFDASGGAGKHAAVVVQEWEILATEAPSVGSPPR